MDKLEKQTRAYTRVQRLAGNQYLRSSRNADKYSESVKKLETNVSDLAIRAQGGVTAVGRLETAQSQAASSSSLLARNLARADSRLRSMNQNLRGGGLTQLGSGMTSAGRGASTLTDNLRRAIGRIKEVGSASAASAGKVTELASSLAKKAAGGMLAFGAASTIAIGASVNTAASFESAFVGVGKTVDGLVELGEDGYLKMTTAGENFKDSLQELTETTLPTTFENAAKVAELGGQLGFVSSIDDIDEAQEALLAFTETIIGLEEATDLSAEAAAQDLSRFANIFREDYADAGDNIRNIGNTIVELGNRSATTESQIVTFATRVAGAGKAAGLSQADVLGISAAFSSIGVNAEAGGTAVSRALLEMQKAANTTNEGFVDNAETIAENERKQRDLVGELRTLEYNTGLSAEAILAQQDAFVAAGGSIADFGEQLGDTRQRRLLGMIEDIQTLGAETEQLKRTHGTPFSSQLLSNFLKVTGTTREEFRRLQKEEPAKLFEMLVEGIAERGDEAGATLETLGFNTAQMRQAFLGMAQNTDLLTDSLFYANQEFDNGNALAQETEKRYATFDSRIQRFKNTLRGTAAEVGSVFLPAIGDMLSGAGPVISLFGDRIPGVIDSVIGKIGELTGIQFGEFDFVTSINAGFDTLVGYIDSFDMTPVQTTIDTISTDVLPTLNGWLTLVSDNWGAFEDVLVALGTAAGIAVTITTLTSIGASVLALLNPITLAIAGVAGLAYAWQTNLGGIQEKTEALVTTVTESVTGITDAFETGGLEGVFDFLEVPEDVQTGITNLLTSFEDISIGTSVEDFFTNLGELFSGPSADVILTGLGAVGDAVLGLSAGVLALGTVAVATTLDQLQGLIDIGANLIAFFDSLLELDSAAMVESLEGVADGFLTIATSPFENIAEAWTGEDLDFTTPVEDALAAVETYITEFVWPEIPLPTIPEGLTEFIGNLSAPFADIEIPESLSNLSDKITDLFSGESAETIAASATSIGEGIGSFVTMLAEAASPTALTVLSSLGTFIAGLAGAFVSLTAISISTTLDVVDGMINAVASLVGIADTLLEGDMAGTTEQISNFVGAIASIATAPIENIVELFSGEDVDLAGAIQTWWDNGITTLSALAWPEITPPEIDFSAMGASLVLAGSQIQTYFTGLFDNFTWPVLPEFVWPDLGLPKFPDLGAKIDEILEGIKDKFTGFLSDIDIGVPETLIDIAGAIGIDLGTSEDDAKAAGEDVGAAIAEGVAQGQIDNAETATAAAADVSEQTWGEWAISWATGSPSLRAMGLGKDIVDGFALGLQDTTTIVPAIEAINILVLEGFTALSNTLLDTTQPALQTFVFAMDNMNTLTLPIATGLLNDGLIPAKVSLASVNDSQVTPSVIRLAGAEAKLGGEIGKVIPKLIEQIERMKATKSNAETLSKALQKLAKRYESLAAAIEKAKRAGSGVARGVTGNEPVGGGTAAGASLQSGGQFVVPSTIPDLFKTPSGGMLAEVHPGELVTVVADPNMSAPRPVKDRAVSGASVQQDISNYTDSSSSQNSFNLHVTEVVSKDVRTSFGLMRALGGFN